MFDEHATYSLPCVDTSCLYRHMVLFIGTSCPVSEAKKAALSVVLAILAHPRRSQMLRAYFASNYLVLNRGPCQMGPRQFGTPPFPACSPSPSPPSPAAPPRPAHARTYSRTGPMLNATDRCDAPGGARAVPFCAAALLPNAHFELLFQNEARTARALLPTCAYRTRALSGGCMDWQARAGVRAVAARCRWRKHQAVIRTALASRRPRSSLCACAGVCACAGLCACVGVCACARSSLRACVRACTRLSVRACMRACAATRRTAQRSIATAARTSSTTPCGCFAPPTASAPQPSPRRPYDARTQRATCPRGDGLRCPGGRVFGFQVRLFPSCADTHFLAAQLFDFDLNDQPRAGR